MRRPSRGEAPRPVEHGANLQSGPHGNQNRVGRESRPSDLWASGGEREGRQARRPSLLQEPARVPRGPGTENGGGVRKGKNGPYPSKMMKKRPTPPDCAAREREASPAGWRGRARRPPPFREPARVPRGPGTEEEESVRNGKKILVELQGQPSTAKSRGREKHERARARERAASQRENGRRQRALKQRPPTRRPSTSCELREEQRRRMRNVEIDGYWRAIKGGYDACKSPINQETINLEIWKI